MFKKLKKKHFNATPYLFIAGAVLGLVICYCSQMVEAEFGQYRIAKYVMYIVSSLAVGYDTNICYTGILIGIDYFEGKSDSRKKLAALLFPCTIWSCLVGGFFWPFYWKHQSELPESVQDEEIEDISEDLSDDLQL